jgi:hypothetical protein
MGFGRRLAASGSDPWLLVASVIGGGLGWAVAGPAAAGVAIGGAVGAGTGGVGAVVGALMQRDDAGEDAEAMVGIRQGTQQASMVTAIERYVEDLRRLRGGELPDSVMDQAISALVAAEGTRDTARRVAAAVDGLDEALRRSQEVAGPQPSGEVRAAMERMSQRRGELITKLHHSVEAVATVYAKLLETSATINSLDVGDEALGEIASVNRSLDQLRGTLTELEEM